MFRTNSLLALTNTDLLWKRFDHDQHFSRVRGEPQVKEGVSIWRQQRAWWRMEGPELLQEARVVWHFEASFCLSLPRKTLLKNLVKLLLVRRICL